jgi:rare lipoprotein A
MMELEAANRGEIIVRRMGMAGLVGGLALLASGCAHHVQPTQQSQQTAPPVYQYPVPDSGPVGVVSNGGSGAGTYSVPRPSAPVARIAPTPAPAGGIDEDDLDYIHSHEPIQSEEGFATWYTAPYKGRRSANGQVFSDYTLTAAHRTLPMGTLIVVTNLTTGQSSAMRITDRGPFVAGRMLDLTKASAEATGVYRAGLVRVRMDVYETPKPIGTGGRWCVQIGAFHKEHEAKKLQSKLEDRYPGANVIEFAGEDSYWVRIRPAGDNREVAERIANKLRLKDADAQAYLTRLD